MNNASLWRRYRDFRTEISGASIVLDSSRICFPENYREQMQVPFAAAFAAMAALEKGAIANPDEQRMVGHYWLRDSSLAPSAAIAHEIENTLFAIKSFAAEIHGAAVKGSGGPFRELLVIGIGGSALGPQFVARALGQGNADKLHPHFFDNTDPDGMELVLDGLRGRLATTLVVVISKSGGTPETRNGMLEAKAAFERVGLTFAAHAAAITGMGSALDQFAASQGWLRRFPMWDWIGGRTSELSAVGLLPAALQGIDIDGLLSGARTVDQSTRIADLNTNPSAQLALAWYFLTDGRGSRDMVVLPYKDRLDLFSRYLQQLVMESLGKKLDIDGRVVNQGISVYGNKGSTDQHAYVQQLRDGVANFFAVFIEVLRDRRGTELEVEPGVTSGDFLNGFRLGTREALFENGRESLTITVPDVTPFSVGGLIALFERAIGLYASLIRINAYHQPGVEAGKKAAATVLTLQKLAAAHLSAHPTRLFTAEELASAVGQADDAETLFHICCHLAANGRVVRVAGGHGTEVEFAALASCG